MIEPRTFSFAADGAIPNSRLPPLRLWAVRQQDSPQRRREY